MATHRAPEATSLPLPQLQEQSPRLTFIKLSSRVATSSLGATDAVCRVRSHHSRPGPRALRLVGPEGAERKWNYLARGGGRGLETRSWGGEGRALMVSNPRSDGDPLGTLASLCPPLGFSCLIYTVRGCNRTTVDGQEGPAHGSVHSYVPIV